MRQDQFCGSPKALDLNFFYTFPDLLSHTKLICVSQLISDTSSLIIDHKEHVSWKKIFRNRKKNLAQVVKVRHAFVTENYTEFLVDHMIEETCLWPSQTDNVWMLPPMISELWYIPLSPCSWFQWKPQCDLAWGSFQFFLSLCVCYCQHLWVSFGWSNWWESHYTTMKDRSLPSAKVFLILRILLQGLSFNNSTDASINGKQLVICGKLYSH